MQDRQRATKSLQIEDRGCLTFDVRMVNGHARHRALGLSHTFVRHNLVLRSQGVVFFESQFPRPFCWSLGFILRVLSNLNCSRDEFKPILRGRGSCIIAEIVDPWCGTMLIENFHIKRECVRRLRAARHFTTVFTCNGLALTHLPKCALVREITLGYHTCANIRAALKHSTTKKAPHLVHVTCFINPCARHGPLPRAAARLRYRDLQRVPSDIVLVTRLARSAAKGMDGVMEQLSAPVRLNGITD